MIGVIPHRLGFRPQESLVVLALHGPRLRDELAMRYDLPDPGKDAELCADVLARLRWQGADGAVVACYTEAAPPAYGLARAPLLRALGRDLQHAGIEMVEALLVTHGRWWSYVCDDDACCPPEGTPLPETLTPAAALYAAESTSSGRAVLSSRDELARTVSADPGVADAGPPRTLTRDGAAAAYLAVLDAVDRFTDGDCHVADDVAQDVSSALAITGIRDLVLTHVTTHDPAVLAAVLAAVARRTPDSRAAPVCSALAWCAYAAGNGALAAVAAERALRAHPGYVLAELVLEGLARMITPEQVRAVSAQVADDLASGYGTDGWDEDDDWGDAPDQAVSR